MSAKKVLITEHDKVRKKWGKTVEDVQKDLKILKEWCQTQRHLPEIPDDNTIEFLLTNCKYSIEKTKHNIYMYYTMRSLIPELFENNNPNLPGYYEQLDKQGDFITLPKLTDTLQRISLIIYNKDDQIFPFMIASYLLNIYEIRMHEDLVMGEILVIDVTHISMGHLMKWSPSILKKVALYHQSVMSNRATQIHILNPPEYFHIIMTVAKGVLKKKIYDRIHLHHNIESLYEYLSPDVLPSNYGGAQDSVEEIKGMWKAKLKDYSKRFDELSNMKVDEQLRPEPLENSEILGYYGNFKKLDVD